MATRAVQQLAHSAVRARNKFLRFFPEGFRDETFVDWERGYKREAHDQWTDLLDRSEHHSLLRKGDFAEIANRAVRIESRTHLLFSFEKMAIRDAVKLPQGARLFAEGLYDFLYGPENLHQRFERWCQVVAALPRKQSRVFTWPIVTVFGFIARPEDHIFFKPMVTRKAAHVYGFHLHYSSRPSWATYSNLLEFTEIVRRDLRDLRPRDMIDIQSFLWVLGSDEYADDSSAR